MSDCHNPHEPFYKKLNLGGVLSVLAVLTRKRRIFIYLNNETGAPKSLSLS
jgi:hypothetical protein